MKEAPVEKRLKQRLESVGFKVLKLVTEGTLGSPDRMILRPTWSKGPPFFVEVKRPSKTERRAQEVVRDQWRGRGALVLDVCDTYERVDEIYTQLMLICVSEAIQCA